MSAAVYAEPYKLPAGALALAVHAAFFALLYFGISWRAEPPQGMVVDIWDSLPEMKNIPAKVTPPEEAQPEPLKPVEPPKPVETQKLAKPAQPAEPHKADIELAEKKKQKAKLDEIKKQMEQKKIIEAEKMRAAQAEQERIRTVQAEQERARAEQAAKAAAAIASEIGKYKELIRSKIRHNIVRPPDVPDNARAEFDVTLLPGGTVLNAKLNRQSGNEAYDAAVERAILKSQPLPLPPDVALFNKFRELHLKFCPEENSCK